MYRKILFCLFCCLFPLSICAQSDALVLVYSTKLNYAENYISLQLDGNVNATIDWGNGDIEYADTDGIYMHTRAFEEGGIVDTVKITGTLNHFCNDSLRMNLLRKVISWGNVGLTDLSRSCASIPLTSVPDSIPKDVTNLREMFAYAYNFQGDVSSWDVSNVTDMSYMFWEAENFNSDISNWDVSNVTDMSYMFCFAYDFNADISTWDVSQVTDMGYIFNSASSLEADISGWDISNVTDMSGMFAANRLYLENISSWDVSKVTNMSGMFINRNLSDCDLSNWDISNVTDMSFMFAGASNFDFISNWDVSNVINMRMMFEYCSDLNLSIDSWDVSNVENMSRMFMNTSNININISSWDVSHVMNMDSLFFAATDFESDLSSWDVSNVTSMSHMFYDVDSLKLDLSKWDVAKVTDMNGMFRHANKFNADISGWDVSNVTDMRYMFSGDTLSTDNYSNMLAGWAELQLQNDVEFSGGYSKYNSTGATARQKIIDTYGWTINDEGLVALFQSFTAKLVDSSIVLNWKVDAEINDSGFALERRYIVSDDTSTWDQVYKVFSDSSLSYSYLDSNLPSADVVHYRLFGLHEDGQVIISDTLVFDISSLTGVELKEGLPTEFVLHQNYPNPFNPTTNIEYSVMSAGNVTLKVYDMIGREVTTLVNKVQPAGNYSVVFDASELASGIYIYRLSAGDCNFVKKMVLLK